MKKVCLLLLVCFAQINGAEKELTTKDYTTMSNNQLGEALITAVKGNNQDTVKKLIQAGANVNQKFTYTHEEYDSYYNLTCTPLEYAIRHGYVDIAQELIKAKPKIEDINNALISAAEEAQADVVRELVQIGSTDNHPFRCFFSPKANKKYLDTALIRAAEKFPGITAHRATGNRNRRALKNYLDVIKLLIKAGAHVNYANDLGNTPLIELIDNDLYTEAQRKNRAEIIDVLLKAGANVNHINKAGEGALVRAIKNHDFDAVQILLKAPKININQVDNNGNTPLIIAVQYVQTSYIGGNSKPI